MADVALTSVPLLRRSHRLRLAGLTAVCVVMAMAAGILAGGLALNGRSVAIVGLLGLTVPIIIWRRLEAGAVLVLFAATLIEQFRYSAGDITDRIPLFTSLSDGVGLRGVYVNPFEIALVVILLIWLTKAIATRTLRLPQSPVALAMVVLLAIVLLAEVRGLSKGGDLRASLWELRPWIYLGASYLIASQVVTTRTALRALLWAFVIGSGIKGIQGTARYLAIRHIYPRPESILSHEEAVFFSLFIVLVFALWLYREQAALRWVATALLPTVLIADLANSRRASWLILLACVACLGVITWIALPHRRGLLKGVAAGTLLVGLLYLPVFWNNEGVFGQPARAVRSLVTPSARDRSSDVYRKIEDINLGLNIRQSTPFGQGFGVPIDYKIPIVDISGIDPSIKFVPHDGILYVWMRLGLPGAIAFWWLIGAALLAACRLARVADRELALFGTLVACGVIAYVLEGHYDMGLTWFRIAIAVGCLLGALEGGLGLAQIRRRTQPGIRDESEVMTNPAGRSERSIAAVRSSAASVVDR